MTIPNTYMKELSIFTWRRPFSAILADIGWHPGFFHNRCNVIRLWCRLMNLPGHSLFAIVKCHDITTTRGLKL